MNQATQELKDNLLGEPVSATVMGAGRVDAFASAKAVSLASPGEPLLRARHRLRAGPRRSRSFKVRNKGKRNHSYKVTGGEGALQRLRRRARPASSSRRTRRPTRRPCSFKLKPQASRKVYVRLNLDPSVIDRGRAGVRPVLLPPERRRQRRSSQDGPRSGKADNLHVPWHVAPLAASDDSLSKVRARPAPAAPTR